jgi:phosphoglycerol transferase
MFARCAGWAHYPIALLLCLGAMVWSLRLDQADLEVPFAYSNDALGLLTLIKGHIENGWYLVNPRLGAPGVHDMRAYPITDVLPLALLKLLGWVWPTPAGVYNLFSLLTFPLTLLAALAVLRHFRVARAPAVAASLLYTFLPCHVLRMNGGHMFLTAYYVVPPAVLLILWICQGRPLFFRPSADGTAGPGRAWGAILVSLGVCLLLASGNAYYAYFSCFLLATAAAFALVQRRDVRAAASAGILIAVIVGGVIATAAPVLVYQRHDGVNPEAQRPAEDADWSSLKISHLLLPVQEHRLEGLARLRAEYSNSHRPLENENNMASLGVVGAAGFLLLLACLLAPGQHLPPTLDALRVLNVATVLLGVVGGFGSLFNFFAFAQLRCYNRVSVFIGFFAMFALACVASRVFFAPGRRSGVRWLGGALLAAVAVAGVWDQTPRNSAPDYARMGGDLRADAEFGRRMEAALPTGALVFQLPYTRFPERSARHAMLEYAHLRPYLHSQRLHFSYGAMADGEADVWQRDVVARPFPEMLKALVLAGFRGLYVDRRGFGVDEWQQLEKHLSAALGPARVTSADGWQSLFDLGDYTARLRAECSPAEWERQRERVLTLPRVLFREGFLANVGPDLKPPRWCRGKGTLVLLNPGNQPRQMELVLGCMSHWEKVFPVEVASDLAGLTGVAPAGGGTLTCRFTLPPGRFPVRLTARPPHEYVPTFPGHVFYMLVLSFREVE